MIYVWVLLPKIFHGISCKVHNFGHFLEKHTGKHISDETLLRKNDVSHCYEKTIQYKKCNKR
jgi:hypothetical protein